jgi:hypothetical protein
MKMTKEREKKMIKGDRVVVLNDVFWSDGEKQHLHVSKGMTGVVTDVEPFEDGRPKMIVKFENDASRQIWSDDFKNFQRLNE